ncbi:hypothetical protein [Leptospira kanakyensis]|uniref:Uncharacterized protein n=1 Tax=Leptospira kanakyensis TaxID=2484968 RepID=A0A6N4Q752_9LEPT|nr:hypothetical protein [Leptospira kanakyensis]MCW7471054.1 hypothetical protein [Leptospira kanakyensis]MCW7483030.1 hypothetical protein [Leptospira kanakyensis]TGK54530.1 hypothetical protein EHQ11_02985 [Leptospira kanakyensis]TGK59002.1 hypothetical protein EHQ16_11630 [Leptospira kanakyensis]TGK75153.1 hypothetical protein EHQ18_02305 [Leptospira kanakyensis]
MRIIKVLFIVGALALVLNCEKKKETACAEDIVCSYLLVNSTVKGNINITASTGALSNATNYNVAVYSAANCEGTAATSTQFSNTGLQSTYLMGFPSNTQYSVRAFTNNNSLSICSSSFSFNIDKQTYNCQIGSTAITCN